MTKLLATAMSESLGPLGTPKSECGGILQIGDCSIPRCAFSITDPDTAEGSRKAQTSEFTYARSARNSVMLLLGFAPSDTDSNTLDTYAKASEGICVELHCSIVLGLGVLRLSTCVSRCGALVGAASLLCYGAMMGFLSHRMVEIPAFVRKSLQTFTDVAKNCWPSPPLWMSVSAMVIASFVGYLFIALEEVLMNVEVLFLKPPEELGFGTKACICLLFFPFAFLRKPASLKKASTWGLWSLGFAISIEMVCAVVNRIKNGGSRPQLLFTTPEIALRGSCEMLPSFCGVPVIPYIVASMLQPEDAKRMVTKSSTRMTAFNFAVGILCFYGWGSMLDNKQTSESSHARTPVEAIQMLGFGPAAYLMGVGLTVRAMTSYGLYFWLISRELESLLPQDSAPPVELGLPWAIRRVKHKQFMLRCTLLLLTAVPQFMPQEYQKRLERFFVAVPMNLANVAFPACLAVTSIEMHRGYVNEQVVTGNWKDAGGDMYRAQYFCGSLNKHFMITLGIAVIMCSLSGFMLLRWAIMTTCYLTSSDPTLCFDTIN